MNINKKKKRKKKRKKKLYSPNYKSYARTCTKSRSHEVTKWRANRAIRGRPGSAKQRKQRKQVVLFS